MNKAQHAQLLQDQLQSLRDSIKSSINHKERSDSSYPIVSKRFNEMLRQLKELATTIPAVKRGLDAIGEYEEKNFLIHGNYEYAVRLSADVEQTIAIAKSLTKYFSTTTDASANPKPLVFISYDGEELALADYVKNAFESCAQDRIETFVARRDIRSGDAPLKVMMDEKLKKADAIVPICSIKSKSSAWLWWESASVWGRGKRIFPLFTNISPNDFGTPITLVTQGKFFFDENEFEETLAAVCRYCGIEPQGRGLSKIDAHNKLAEEYSKPETSAAINITYKKLQIEQALHKYSLIFEVKNRSSKAFENIVVELFFPEEYMERKQWRYDHINSTPIEGGYLCLTFDFSAMPETAKKQFSKDLLPGRTLRIFGENGISNFHYEVDNARWEQRGKYQIKWNVFINGGAPQEGSAAFEALQIF